MTTGVIGFIITMTPHFNKGDSVTETPARALAVVRLLFREKPSYAVIGGDPRLFAMATTVPYQDAVEVHPLFVVIRLEGGLIPEEIAEAEAEIIRLTQPLTSGVKMLDPETSLSISKNFGGLKKMKQGVPAFIIPIKLNKKDHLLVFPLDTAMAEGLETLLEILRSEV